MGMDLHTSFSEVGTINVVDSLFAIRQLVFMERVISIKKIVDVLDPDFLGHKSLRQHILNRIPKYGNDNEEVDAFAHDIVDMTYQVVRELNLQDFRGGGFVPGSGCS